MPIPLELVLDSSCTAGSRGQSSRAHCTAILAAGQGLQQVLVKGMEGEDVQRKLNARLGLEQQLAEDGICGDNTDTAVRDFQEGRRSDIQGRSEIYLGSGVVVGATVNIPSQAKDLHWNMCKAW